MTRRRRFFFALKASGLALWIGAFAVGASGRYPDRLRPLGTLTSTAWSWGFFAPRVAAAVRVRLICDSIEVPTATSSREVSIRYGAALATLADSHRREIACHLSGYAPPHGDDISVVLEAFELPPPERYREGARGIWAPFYRVDFRRRTTETE